MTDSAAVLPEATQRGNIWCLAIAQALAGANAVTVYAAGAIIGSQLASSPVLATLPISVFVVGMAACILPAGAIARRHGRRAAFMAGTAAGVLAGLLAMVAVLVGDFWLFCLGTFFGGAYAAVVLSFRFAAADGVAPERRARALSLVMAGGVAAGVVGPQMVTWTMDLWPPHAFAATFLVQALVAAASAMILLGVRLPMPTAEEMAGGRPLGQIARQPRFVAAVICGAVSYLLMNFLMTAAPLAMHMCGHSQATANLGLQWHVIAMYAPSFFTGSLITRFGAGKVASAGLALTGVSAAVGLGGVDVAHFWATLVLLGLGWNFGFLGASALVLECHRPEEKTRVQSFNDFIVFGLMAVGSFASGGLLSAFGWNAVLWVSFVPLGLAFAALAAANRKVAAAEADLADSRRSTGPWQGTGPAAGWLPPTREHQSQRVVLLDVVVDEGRQGMQSDDPISRRSDHLVDFLDLPGQRLVLAHQRRQVEAEERDRLARCAQDDPACQWHADHEGVQGHVHDRRRQLLPRRRHGHDWRCGISQAQEQADPDQREDQQPEHEMQAFHGFAGNASLVEQHTKLDQGIHDRQQDDHRPVKRDRPTIESCISAYVIHRNSSSSVR